MKRTFGLIGLAILWAWLVMPQTALPWQEEPKPGEADIEAAKEGEPEDQEAEEGNDETEDDSGQPAGKRKGRRPKDDTRQRLKQLDKLQEAMKKKMDLSEEQKESIDALFAEHLEQLAEHRDSRPTEEQEAATGDDILAMRDELVAARDSGDREKTLEIAERMRTHLRSRGYGKTAGTGRFFEKLEAELDDNQRQTFRQLLKRLKLDRFIPPKHHPVRSLWRAVMHPDVGLNAEQRDKMRELRREAGRAMGPIGADAEELEQVAAELREDIFRELTEEQQEKVERLLERGKRRPGKGQPFGRPHREPSEEGESKDSGDEE